MGVQECAEPVINGVSLVDMLARVESASATVRYAGLAPAKLLEPLHTSLESAEGTDHRVQVLRCVCGDMRCSWATLEVACSGTEVTWANIHASRAEPETYASIGPFRFARAQYGEALANRGGPSRRCPIRARSRFCSATGASATSAGEGARGRRSLPRS